VGLHASKSNLQPESIDKHSPCARRRTIKTIRVYATATTGFNTRTNNKSLPISAKAQSLTKSYPNVLNVWRVVSRLHIGDLLPVDSGQFIVINHTSGERQEVNVVGDEAPVENIVVVDFDINVPVYVSNELQVKVSWGNQKINASW